MPQCSICGDTGYLRHDVPQGHPDFGKVVICGCQQERIARTIQFRIGTSYDSSLTMESVKVRGDGSRRMKAEAEKFIRNPENFLTFYGMEDPGIPKSSPNGNGKTTCLQAIVNECVRKGIAAVYVTCSDMIEFLKAGIGDEDYDVEDRLNVLCGLPVLAVDEISQPNWTPWVEDKLTTLINRRYTAQLGTVLALDEDPERFLHRRLYSRLREGTLVKNSDPDMRVALGSV